MHTVNAALTALTSKPVMMRMDQVTLGGVSVGSILTVASAKGGCGKSALTTILAVNLAAGGHRVAVIDSDPNQGFADWHRDAYEGPALTVSSESSHLEIVDHAQRLAEDHDVALIDTAGFSNQCSAMAMGTADMVLI